MKKKHTKEFKKYKLELKEISEEAIVKLMELTSDYAYAKKVLSEREFKTLLRELNFDGCTTEKLFLKAVIKEVISTCELFL